VTASLGDFGLGPVTKAYTLWPAGLPTVRFYDFRPTFSTLMFKQEAKPKVVQEMLGHSTIKTTLDTYTHVIPGMQKEALETLGKLF
jgi:integrase